MALEYRLDAGARVAVLAGERLRTVKDWLTAVQAGVVRARQGSADALLLDFREAGFTPSARDASALVAAIVGGAAEQLPPVAVLTNPGVQFGGARVLCMMGELRGCVAAAFQDEDGAWRWLRSAIATESPDGGAPIARTG